MRSNSSFFLPKPLKERRGGNWVRVVPLNMLFIELLLQTEWNELYLFKGMRWNIGGLQTEKINAVIVFSIVILNFKQKICFAVTSNNLRLMTNVPFCLFCKTC